MPLPELRRPLVAILVLLAACSSAPAASGQHLSTEPQNLHAGQVVDGVPCLTADLPQRHIHIHLQVLVNGANVAVPAGLGVGRPWGVESNGFISRGACFAWIHTHDTSGVIHVVTPEEKSFSLGQLFEVWGQRLDARSALGYQGPLRVLVDGRRYAGDPRSIRLSNLDNVVLELGTPPRTAPASTFDFFDLTGLRYPKPGCWCAGA